MFNTFYDAWHFLTEHPCFENQYGINHFDSSLYIMVVKVNPENESIEDDDILNTETRVWLEAGPYIIEDNYKGTSHDIDLDCGGNTFEEAIITLAGLVANKYGLY